MRAKPVRKATTRKPVAKKAAVKPVKKQTGGIVAKSVKKATTKKPVAKKATVKPVKKQFGDGWQNIPGAGQFIEPDPSYDPGFQKLRPGERGNEITPEMRKRVDEWSKSRSRMPHELPRTLPGKLRPGNPPVDLYKKGGTVKAKRKKK